MKAKDRLLLLPVMLVMLLASWSSKASACALEQSANYMVMLQGSNKLNIKLPLYDKEGIDCWLVEGIVYIQIEGEQKETLFHCESEHNIGSDDYAPFITCYAGVEGTMVLNRSRGYSQVTIGRNSTKELCPCMENLEYAMVDLTWTVPSKYRGKTVTISWYIHHDGNTAAEADKTISVKPTTLTIPTAPDEILPTVMDPIIAFDASRPNQMMVPYMMATNNILDIWTYYSYYDTASSSFKWKLDNLDKTKTSDFLYLPANQRVKGFHITAKYKNSEGDEVTTSSTDIDLPILHHAKNLSASLMENGHVEVKWNIEYPEWKDLADNDSWEIQRNLSGSPNNTQWITIGQLEYDPKAAQYTFEDESFLTSYEGNRVYYRVRRVVTAVWNWCDGSGYAQTILNDIPALPAISGGTVSRAGNWTDSSHGVTVQFNMGWPADACVLRNAEDWKNFAQRVNNGESVNAIMVADIDLGTEPLVMVGSSNAPYRGTFEGNGHTLTFNPPTINEDYAAPFRYVSDASICNLHTKGTITTNGKYAAGLVAYVVRSSTLNIENCISSVNLTSTVSDEAHIGGFVGLTMPSTQVNIKNSLFDGSIEGEHCHHNGGLVGYAYYAVSIQNCLFAPSKLNTSLDGCETFVITKAGTLLKVSNSAYTASYGGVPTSGVTDAKTLSAEALRDYLGDGWTVSEGKVIPVVQVNSNSYNTLLWDNLAKVVLNIDKTVGDEVRYTERHELTDDERNAGKVNLDLKTSCVDHRFRMTVERGNSKLPVSTAEDTPIEKTETGEEAIYRFDNNVVLSQATVDTLQNGVKLSWEATRGQADYYRILRYDKMTPETVDTLQNNYTQTTYVDYSVRPQHSYMFIIEGVTQCEGDNISKVTVEGGCRPTGMVRGYVRLPNGTGLPGYTVTAQPMGGIPGAVVRTCVTDKTGFFEIDSLVYVKYGEYMLSVSDPTGEASFTSQIVTFDDNVNLQVNINFTQPNYYIFSGYVLYEGSSIPVSDVHFLRDGQEVVNASGKPVTTDNHGAFSVSVPQGSHQIQIVKEGHVFKNKGFFITPDAKPDSTWHNWTKSVSEVYLWDQTKVTLHGRVVGGKDQGELKLGESLSKNNLGDDLTLVFQLEGDNTSWMVRDQLDGSVTERHEKITHGKSDTTLVDTYRHRIVIHPDVKTGEYQLPLYPVKYKVTEIYAKGYPTLFQTGMVSETLDLNHCLNGDTAVYKRIYHSEPTLDIWQFTGSNDNYYGIKQYTAMDVTGRRDTIQLWHDGHYSLGYPVFVAGASVPMMLSAREEYRYNNEQLGELDVVQLNSGKVIINNGLIASDHSETLELDQDGQATYVFTPQNATFMLKDDMALRRLKMTLLYDGSYYDIKPINAFVMASRPKSEGRRIVAGRNTHLIDILRDPPGGASYSYIESGSKFSYSYTADLTILGGLDLSFGVGYGSNFYTGVVAGGLIGAGTEAGAISSSTNIGTLTYSLVSGKYEDWTYNYVFETKERISTSSNVREIGANSDVYIGMTDDVIVEDALAVRVVNKKALELLRPGMGGTTVVDNHEYKVTGTTEVLARGWDETKKDSIFLIRDEVMQFSTKINSTFIHSQHYLVEELIPNLIRQRDDMLLDYTATSDYAQSLANQQKSPVYVSKVARDDAQFGTENYYTTYYPQGEPNTWNDSIQALNSEIMTWAGFIKVNEKEKLEARELVKVYDFDGASSVDYSETFTTNAGMHRYIQLPSMVNIGGGNLSKTIQPNPGHTTDNGDLLDTKVDFVAGGVKFTFGLSPVFNFDFNYKNGVDSTLTKTVGFKMACSRRSNLSVAVYHENPQEEAYYNELKKTGSWDAVYYSHVEENLKNIYNGRAGSSNTTSYIANTSLVPRCRNLVFRTLGGATASPWEDEVRTIIYNPGTVLDQKTMEIDKLRIWAKEASVSNVPYGEPARFTIYMTNESEFPDRVTRDLKYYLEDATNAGGAKVLVDGFPLTVSGIDLWLEPNTVIEKQVEVYAGAGYDYEDIGISLFNTEDALLDSKRVKTVNLSAHFVPAAGPVNISRPGDKWVVNTESAYDEEEKAYYLPVHIDGFDVNFRNFDHIELQYKLSTQGDKDWVNVCSYYRDNEEGRKLMAQASGERQLIKSEGHIDAAFYGEKDPIEQYYDLRAVTYCRQGSGYLTRSSNILTGIKDTRRPQLFGTPQPVDGILDIGDDIILRFSEPIAGNYLSAVNNFEVTGHTNSTNISLSSALRFNGEKIQMGFNQSARNLTGRSFTIDMMLNPDDDGKSKTFFCHGEADHLLELGLTADNRLTAAVSYDQKVAPAIYTATTPCKFDGLREVFCIFDADTEKGTTDITFYDGNNQVGNFTYPRIYEGNGGLFVGQTIYDLLKSDENYSGEMLEFRLWNRALNTAEMNSYCQKQLTGSELGLLDNYPLNEGEGNYSYNRVSEGSDLFLLGHTWKIPNGIAMKLDGEKGFRMNSTPFNRFDHEDYTLMFKFRTSDDGTLLANGRGTTEAGSKSHFCFHTQKGVLKLNLSGLMLTSGQSVNDGQWHHTVLSVNRSRNVGCLYIDQKLTNTFAVDTLGGISGNLLAAGATYLDNSMVEGAVTGHIDEIAMYEMALSENAIKELGTTTPIGTEMGMMAYLSFSENKRQADNTMRLMPTGVSLHRYKDLTTGELTEQRDTIVAQNVVDRLYDRQVFAPMHDKQEQENIKFSYVADGKDLLMNLDVPEATIEKSNVYIVVKGVTDLQGNQMASPVMMDLYVYRNPLRWTDKHLSLTSHYGDELTFTATIQNLSGKRHSYELQGLPTWMKASTLGGTISAQDEETITFSISPYTNIGNFEEIIYMLSDDGMSEPLPISLKVRGETPDWSVDEDLLRTNISMSLIGQVKIDGNVARDSEDMLAAFDVSHRLLGVAHLTSDMTNGANDGLVFLNIYNTDYSNIPLNFEYFDASMGVIYKVKPVNGTLLFQNNTVMGTTTDPVAFVGERNGEKVQAIQLKKGWNWVSFNVKPAEGTTVKQLLNNTTKWQVGDALEAEREDGSLSLLSYKAIRNPYDPNNPTYSWDCADELVKMNPTKMYRFYSSNDKVGYIAGSTDYLGITVTKGWNRLGFMSNINLPLATALADYAEQGSAGDIVKSQSEFAVLTEDASGNKSWRGTLEFLRVGEGYMLKRNADSEATFYYPYYYLDSRYSSNDAAAAHRAPAFQNVSGTSMTVVAVAEGVDVQPGDRLTAYRGAEICGIAEANEQGVFFLSVGDIDNVSRQLSFTIERDDEIVAASTRNQMSYQANADLGTLSEPTAISFIAADNFDADGWYTVGGVKLNKRPTQTGVYIHHNEKVVIK